MKKYIALMLALLLALAMPIASAESFALQVINCNEWVSLREWDSEDAPRLCKVPRGAQVYDCTFAENGYICCIYEDTVGYILSDYLSGGGVFAPAMQVVNCENWVSLRSEDDTSSQRLAQVPLNAAVTDCTFAGSGFVRCTYNGVTGYVLAEYLSPMPDEEIVGSGIAQTGPIEPEPTEPIAQISFATAPQISQTGGMPASAESFGEQRQISGCDTWVSLRSEPSSGATRLAKIPLGAVITNCDENGAFTRCRWNGVEGYVLTAYTAPVGSVTFTHSELKRFGSVTTQPLGDCTLAVARGYGDMETLRISLMDSAMQPLWSNATACDEIAMVNATDAFAAGTAAQPMVALFNSTPFLNANLDCDALTLIDAGSGLVCIGINQRTSGLYGGGICYAVDADGNMYIGGYLGPDPVCISAEGNVLWTSSANDDDIFWLYQIDLTPGGILARYESGASGEMSGDNYWEVFFSVDPSIIAEDPFLTPARTELKRN